MEAGPAPERKSDLLLMEESPTCDAAAEGDFVGVLQIATHRNSTGDDAYFNQVFDPLVYIECGGVSFHRRA